MRVVESKPPSKSGMSWLKQKEQQGGRSDMGTPEAEAYQDHPRRVVECLTRGCQLVPEWAGSTADPCGIGELSQSDCLHPFA